MFSVDNWQILFVVSAFLFQVILIAHFALRKWHFDIAMRYGPIVYALLFVASTLLNLTSHKGAKGRVQPAE